MAARSDSSLPISHVASEYRPVDSDASWTRFRISLCRPDSDSEEEDDSGYADATAAEGSPTAPHAAMKSRGPVEIALHKREAK
jgi:hypothetical protein